MAKKYVLHRNWMQRAPHYVVVLFIPVINHLTMPKLLILLFLPLTLGAQWKPKINSIDSVLSRLYALHLFNGNVLIAEQGKAIYQHAFGVADTMGNPLSTASSFNLASVSKQFFAMMVMILQERGKLNYDDPADRYLPSFPYPAVTIRHLLTHTSGVPEYFVLAEQNRTLLDTLTNGAVLRLLSVKRPPLLFPPGDRFRYCNTNYVLLEQIIEKVSGLAIADFFKREIVQPLHLKDTYICTLSSTDFPNGRVYGFHYSAGRRVPDDLQWVDGVTGDGNIYASADDLLRWEQALYSGKLVSAATLQTAMSPAVLNNGSRSYYGFGWSVGEDGQEMHHNGSWAGFRTYIGRRTKTRQTIIVLENSGIPLAGRLVNKILSGETYTLPVQQLITNITLVDGTGSVPRKSAVRITDDRVTDVGDLSPLPFETVTNGGGRVLAPGFIDSHSHHERGLDNDPSALAVTSQGVTTIITGQDGSSLPVDTLIKKLELHRVSVNVGTFTGHATLRAKVMAGTLQRVADSAETAGMIKLLNNEIGKGSLGLSTGLEYEETFYSTEAEVIALAKATAAGGGRYISHIRSEDVNLEAALREIISIGRQAHVPVQVSHIKIAMRSKWGSAPRVLAMLQQARSEGIDITADCYPYTAWASTPRVLFPKKDFTSLSSATYATRELFDPAASVITYFPANKKYEGKTVSAIATMNHQTEPEALLQVIKESAGEEAAIAGASMSEGDLIDFLKWGETNLCSDGADGGHPRGYGAFTRFLGRYVRDQHIMPLETAVCKMTGLAAAHLGIPDRGIIAPGNFADLVLFDAATVTDKATMSAPRLLSSGIILVWVNGQIVFRDGKTTGQFPGRFLVRYVNSEP
jgi:N-acyl-D-amino-acid deacylase